MRKIREVLRLNAEHGSQSAVIASIATKFYRTNVGHAVFKLEGSGFCSHWMLAEWA